jgi:putative ABC transport system permease protein
MTPLLTELRTSLRTLSRTPGFLIAGVLTLALGLGANVILFNAIYALLWRPLAFPEPERLVSVVWQNADGSYRSYTSLGEAALLRDRTGAFSEVGLTGGSPPIILSPDEGSARLAAGTVNLAYLRALQLHPLCGRFFTEEEERGKEPVALLTETAWRDSFGADPGVIGRTVATESMGQRGQLRIVGVIPGDATLPFASEARVLLPGPAMPPSDGSWDPNFSYRAVLRLQPGLARAAARARVQATVRAAEEHWPLFARGGSTRYDVVPVRDRLAPANRKAVLLLYGAAVLLLVLTCANAASLFLDRALGRRHETAVRVALGASLWRILRSSLTESLLVCGAGSALALALERLARPLLTSYMPDLAVLGPELLDTGPVLLLFGLLSCLLVALTVALLPAWQARNPDLTATLAQGGNRGSIASMPWRSFLVAAQVAIILVLLTVGGLVGRSFVETLRVDPGYAPRGVVTVEAWLPMARDRRTAADYELLDLIEGMPGTERASFAVEHPLGEGSSTGFKAGDGDFLPTDDVGLDIKAVGSGYFETLGARVVAGRTFSEDEVRRWADVVILNESAARRLFGHENPLGRVARSAFLNRRNIVVGVVKDLRIGGLDQPAPPVAYFPFTPWGGTQTFLVRTREDPAAFAAALRTRVRAMNAGIRLMAVESLEQATDDTVRHRLRAGVLVGGFALLGLLIGSVGLYGILSSQVRERRREIGIRVAVGATPRAIALRILGHGGSLVGAGAAAGLVGSALAARLVQRDLYGIGPLDLPSFGLALTLLLLAALLACLIPARRAAKVDPMVALRCE